MMRLARDSALVATFTGFFFDGGIAGRQIFVLRAGATDN
jgi:hypothetical protein